ncbi:hypothetical protein BOX15_Mlig020699g3, partial [Macrostomum lignano]
ATPMERMQNCITDSNSPNDDHWMTLDGPAMSGGGVKHAVHWFRRDLRLHDNASLLAAARQADNLRCVFLLDCQLERHQQHRYLAANKWRFLVDCLRDLDESLRRLGSRLFVVRGQPLEAFRRLLPLWGASHLSFEEDCTPLGRDRDSAVTKLAHELGVTVLRGCSQTLYSQQVLMQASGGELPLTFAKFHRLLLTVGSPPAPCPSLQDEAATLPPPPPPLTPQLHPGFHRGLSNSFSNNNKTSSSSNGNTCNAASFIDEDAFNLPTLGELGLDQDEANYQPTPVLIRGGETEALARLTRHMERRSWVATYGGKPRYQSQLLMPSGTCLSSHLAFGCLSPKLVYAQLTDLYRKIKGGSSAQPPPLHIYGELLWREYLYLTAHANPNFDRLEGNPMCLPIPWCRDQAAFGAWSTARTGVPWIDAIMTQIRLEGWAHPYCRYSAVAFLTRGHLFQNWEDGAKLFEQLLIDAEWPTNNGLWLWMSGSAFFQAFGCAYSPVIAGRKLDPQGDYIRHYLPQLARLPTRYLHEPWLAPPAVQEAAGCIIGRHYPAPMLPDLDEAAESCASRLRAVYAALLTQSGTPTAASAAAAATAAGGSTLASMQPPPPPPPLTSRPSRPPFSQASSSSSTSSALAPPHLTMATGVQQQHQQHAEDFVLDMLASPTIDDSMV